MVKKEKPHCAARKQMAIVLLALGVLSLAACSGLQDMYVERVLKKTPTGEIIRDLSVIRVILCGTGSPQVNAKSDQPCTLVAAGGKVFLFDAGENAMRAIQRGAVPLSSISNVFITHWHSDHFAGLDGVINNSWLNGRKVPLTVYGPEGVDEIVKGISAAYRLDVRYRTAHFVQNPELAFAHTHTVRVPDRAESVVVYREDGITIEACLVDHRPVEPALGYIFTYRGKKIFISGDTLITEGYFKAMQNADLVVHEAVNRRLIQRASAIMRRLGMAAEADHAERILEYHADTLELGAFAQRAGVKHLVLTHLIPEPSGWLARIFFLQGMSDVYRGRLTIGRDGMMIDVPVD
jgi:ribonuclease Z